MSRYAELGDELNEILEQRRKLCGNKYNMGLCPERGNEAEWQRLTDRAAEIREEMKVVRYGKSE